MVFRRNISPSFMNYEHVSSSCKVRFSRSVKQKSYCSHFEDTLAMNSNIRTIHKLKSWLKKCTKILRFRTTMGDRESNSHEKKQGEGTWARAIHEMSSALECCICHIHIHLLYSSLHLLGLFLAFRSDPLHLLVVRFLIWL